MAGNLLPSSLQMQVSSGTPGSVYDGVIGSTPALSRTHYRNLGYDSVNGSGPGQELDITGTSGTFNLGLTIYNNAGITTFTTAPPGSNTAQILNIASTTLSSDIQSAVIGMLNNMLTSEGLGNLANTSDVSVTEDLGTSGNVYRILFSGPLSKVNIPLMTVDPLGASPPPPLPVGSTVAVNPIYGLTVSNPLFLNGNGVLTSNGEGTGALDSISGLNSYLGPINLSTALNLPGVILTNISTVASIGVSADARTGHNLQDSNYLTDDYSLTIQGNGTTSGIVAGRNFTTLDKFGLGNLILPTANNYVGPNDIQQGFVTVGNNQSLGVQQNITQTLQSYTTVASGAAVMLDPQNGFLALANNFVLSGNGIIPGAVIPSVYGLIDQGGAIENLNGNNLLTGIIQLDGNAGIGVEQVYAESNSTTSTGQLAFPAQGTTPTSQLTITGTLEDFTNPVTSLVTSGGITKLGSRRLIIQGPGTYTGSDIISEGVILLQNSTGLGEGNVTSPPTVTVDSGAALEIGNTATALAINNSLGGATFTSSETGGIRQGLEVWGEHLILNGAGDPTFGDTVLTVLSSNAATTGPEVQTVEVSTAGTFQLTYAGQTTITLPINSTAAAVQTALDNIINTTVFPGAYATVNQSGNVYLITVVNPTAPNLPVGVVSTTGQGNTAQAFVGTTQTGSTASSLAPVNDPLVATDNAWEGPASFSSNVTITVPTNSRLIMAGNIDNGTNKPNTSGYGGSSLTFTGGGELDLDGNNSYSGTTFIDQGVVTAGSNTALGTTGVPEIQTIKLTNAVPNSTAFTLTFTSLSGVVETTSVLTYTGSAGLDALNIQKALNALPGIANSTTPGVVGSDVGGNATVTESIGAGTATITITFGGTLSGFPQNLLGAAIVSPAPSPPTPAPAITVFPLTTQTTGEGGTIVANGASLQLSGAITIAGEPLIIQGTGSLPDIQTLTNNATSGTFDLNFTGKDITGNVVTDQTVSPLGVTDSNLASEIQSGLSTLGNIGGIGGTVDVAMDTQTLTISAGAIGTFTLSYIGPNSSGTTVTDTTTALNFSSPTLGNDIQNALNALSNIGGVGGSLSVTQTSTGIYSITFGGAFAGNPVSTLTSASGSVSIVVAPVYTIVFGGALSGAALDTLTYTPVTAITGSLSTLTEQVGVSAAQNIPTQWFQVGPTTVSGGQTAGNQAVAGSVTAEAVDPNDPNTIYIATAGGGVWKTINGGKNWYPIFNAIPEIQQITLSAPSSFTLSLGGDTTSSLNPLSTSDPNLALDMQSQLDQLGSVGGVGGDVTIFENGAVNDIQALVVTATAGTFTLSYKGQDSSGTTVTDTTTTLNVNSPTLASDIQNALMAPGMTNISGVGGTVSVVKNGNTYSITFGGTLAGLGLQNMTVNDVTPFIGGTVSVTSTQIGSTTFQVTFGGSLAGFGVAPITVNPSNVGAVSASVLESGAAPSFALYVGSIAIDPNNPNTIYVGTGVGNNSGDGFYGTGIYVSTNAGVTWSLMTNNTVNNPNAPVNPFYGKVVTGMQVDPSTGALVVSDGDNTTGQDEVQTLTFFGNIPNPFTLSLTAADKNGELFTYTTPNLNLFSPTLLTDIDTALDAFPNIGGVGGFVVAAFANGGITVTFEGTLSNINLNALETNFPLPQQVTPPAPAIGVQISAVSGPTTDVNGTVGGPGVWMYNSGNQTWNILTDTVSVARSSINSQNKSDNIYGPGGTLGGMTGSEPGTPGPDDNYQAFFPQSNATWTDVAITFDSQTGQPVLFAALGSSDIGTVDTPAGTPVNAVYWSTDFEDAVFGNPASVTWFEGNPWTGSVSGGNAVYTPDNEDASMFPQTMFNVPATNPFSTDNSGGSLEPLGEENGNIKISAYVPPPNVVVGATSNEPNFGPNGSGNGGFAVVYAMVSSPSGALKNVYVSNDGGINWAAVLGTPSNSNGLFAVLSNEGQYANAILATTPTTVYIGGQSSLGNIPGQTGQIYVSTNSGGNWNDISVLNGVGPHDSQHAIVQDDNNGVLFGNDGGVWLLSPNNSTWTDVNGNLSNLEVNSVAADPTNITGIPTSPATITTIAGLQSNGTAGFTTGQTWSELDASAGGEMSTSQVFIDPVSPNIVYEVQTQIGSGSGAIVRESNNYGAAGSWNTILSYPSNPAIQSATMPMEMDQINPERLVVGGGSVAGLWQTIDGSDPAPVWTNIGVNLPIDVTAIGLAQYQGTFTTDPAFADSTDQGADAYVSNTFYVTDGNNVYLTKDGGLTWADRTNQLTGLGSILKLVVDPTNMNTVYAIRNVFGGSQIWESTNAGQKWTEIGTAYNLPDVPVWSLVVDPRNGNLYAGTDIGVYELAGGATGASTWQPFGTGMPNVQVHDLVLNQTTNILLAGTYGQGVYELFLDTAETTASSISTSALTGLSGGSVWDGPVILAGTAPVAIGAFGTPNLPNGISSSSIDILGQISDLVATNEPTIDKVGLGDVVFAGINIYGGLTDVQQGNLVVDSEQALGQYSAGTVDGTIVEVGATLALESNLGAETITLNGDGSSFDDHNTGSLRNISGNNIFLGNVILGSNDPNATITIGADSGSTLTLDGVISSLNSDTLVKEGAGIVTFNSNNTYTGPTEIYQGALQTQAPSAFSTGNVEVLDGGQLQIQAPNTLVVAAGSAGTFKLNVSGLGTTATLNAASVTLAGDIQTALNNLISSLVVTNPFLAGAFAIVEQISAGVFTVEFGGALIGDGIAALSVTNAALTSGTVAVEATPITVGNPLTISGAGINNSGVPGALLNLGGNNTWAGNVTLALLPGFSQSTFPTGDVEIGVGGNSTLTITGSVGELQEVGQSDAGFRTIGQNEGLNKVGTGELVLQNRHSSPNTYSGGTVVSQGVMVVGDSGALGTHPSLDPALDTVEQVVTLSDDHVGTFQLSFDGATSSMSYGTTAVNMESKLNSAFGLFAKAGFMNVGATVVETPIEATTQTLTTSSTNGTGNLYTITFGGSLADTIMPLTATGFGGTMAAGSFVPAGGEDVLVQNGAELDLNNSLAPLPPTQLAAPITDTNSTDTITVSNAANIAVSTIIQVDNEEMQVTGISGNDLTVTRGVDHTTIATHSNTATVDILPFSIDLVGHTFSLNGTGVNTLNSQGQVSAANGALQNTAGDNILEGTVNPIVVVLPQTQPGISGTTPSLSAASGTSLTLDGAIHADYLMVGGDGTGYNGNNGGGTVILPSGTTFLNKTVILGGTVQDDGTLGAVGLEGGAVGGSGKVGQITDFSNSTPPEGINPGDNGDSVLTNNLLTYPNEIAFETGNSGTVALTTSGVVLGSKDTYYAFVPAPAAPNTLLQVDGTINLGGALLAGYVNPNVLPSFSPAATIMATDYSSNSNDVISNYFLDQTPIGSPPTTLDTQLTGVPGLGVTAFVVHTTSAYIGNEKFLVDYIGATATGSVYEIVVRRVTENVTITPLAPSVPAGAPITQLSSSSWQVEYGSDVKFTMDLVPESSQVILTGSTVLFQIVDAFGKTYQFNEPVVPVSPFTLVNGVTEYEATVDLPEALTVPLATTTVMSPPSSYTVSALYDGQTGSGAILFNPQSDGIVVGEPGNTIQRGPAATLTVAPTSTTTTLDVQIQGSSSTTTSVFGQQITLIATVNSTLPQSDQPTGLSQPVSPPQGTVSFYDRPPGSSSPVFLGVGTLSTSGGVTSAQLLDSTLPVGNHLIYAVYNADGNPENYTASTSSTLPDLVVTPATDSMTLSAVPSTISYNGQITFTATVTGQFAGDPTGTVTFKLADGTVIGTQQLFTVGNTTSAIFQTPAFGIPGASGPQTIYATYPGDGNFEPSSATTTVTVNPIGSSVSQPQASETSITAGDSVTFTVTISPSISGGLPPTGNVVWQLNGTNVGTTQVFTQFGIAMATFTTTALVAPSDTIVAVYQGDNNYTGNTSPTDTEAVSAANVSVTVSATPSKVTGSQAVTLSALVQTVPGGSTATSGIIDFFNNGVKVGSAPIVNGIATILVPLGGATANGLPAHKITASLETPNGSFTQPSPSNTALVNVYLAGARASKVTLTSSQNPSVIGNSVTFTATVRDAGAAPVQTPTGTISFVNSTTGVILGYAILSSPSKGVATASLTVTLTASNFKVGNDSIVANYSGSPVDFATKVSAALIETVNGSRLSTVTVTSSSPFDSGTGIYNSVYGQAAAFTATVTDAGSGAAVQPKGTVTFSFDDTTTNVVTLETMPLSTVLNSPTETDTFSTTSLPHPLPVGSYTVTATYNGDSDFAPEASPSITQQISQATSTTGLAISTNSTTFGQAVTLTATVTPQYSGGVPTGTVSFYANGNSAPFATVAVTTKLGVTTAVYKSTTLPANSYSITATYSGDNDVLTSSTTTPVSLTVSQANTHTAIGLSSTSSNTAIAFTGAVVVVAPGAGVPTGTESFYVDNVFMGTVSLNAKGRAAIILSSGLTVGYHTFTVVYNGDNNFAGSSTTEVVDIVTGRGT